LELNQLISLEVSALWIQNKMMYYDWLSGNECHFILPSIHHHRFVFR